MTDLQQEKFFIKKSGENRKEMNASYKEQKSSDGDSDDDDEKGDRDDDDTITEAFISLKVKKLKD